MGEGRGAALVQMVLTQEHWTACPRGVGLPSAAARLPEAPRHGPPRVGAPIPSRTSHDSGCADLALRGAQMRVSKTRGPHALSMCESAAHLQLGFWRT
eukprot:366382-Chlamydomonas_euryale.AAC.3